MPAPDFLEWLNLAIIPGVAYIVILERRLMRVELMLGLVAAQCTKSKACRVGGVSNEGVMA